EVAVVPQAEQSREEFAAGQVARGPEDHDRGRGCDRLGVAFAGGLGAVGLDDFRALHGTPSRARPGLATQLLVAGAPRRGKGAPPPNNNAAPDTPGAAWPQPRLQSTPLTSATCSSPPPRRPPA